MENVISFNKLVMSNVEEGKGYWYVYGNKYDLTNFLDNHPGGRMILETSKNEHDITPLFESYHQFADLESIKQSLEKYLVEKDVYKQKFTYNDDGFYKVLTNRVRNHFKAKSFYQKKEKSIISIIKADAQWWFDMISSFSVLSCLYYYAFLTNTIPGFLKPLVAFSTAYVFGCIGFILMHDASHYALFANRKVNTWLSYIWNTSALWNYKIWEKHHTVRHHAFTGDINYDPDTIHYYPLLNKRPEVKSSVIINKYKWIHPFFYIFILPGTFLGQIVSYLLFHFRKRMLKMSYPTNCLQWYDVFLTLPVLFVLFSSDIITSICFLVGLNVCYANCIIGDHDTVETYLNYKEDATDWGEIQVRNSGNFKNNTPFEWFARLHGGINYQIEHHLFPNICHSYYPEIAVIVRKTCKEFNIPYVHHENLINVYRSFNKLIKLSNN